MTTFDLEDLRHGPGGVVAHRARADAALGADEGDDVADGIGVGIVVEIGEALDQLQRRDRRDQILADAALQQLAVEHDVVGMADHDHLGARVAALGEPVELGQHLRARQAGLDDDQVRRRALVIVRDGGVAPPMCTLTCDLASRRSVGRRLHAPRRSRRPRRRPGSRCAGSAAPCVRPAPRSARHVGRRPARGRLLGSPAAAERACLLMLVPRLVELRPARVRPALLGAGRSPRGGICPGPRRGAPASAGSIVRGPSRSAGLAICAARLCCCRAAEVRIGQVARVVGEIGGPVSALRRLRDVAQIGQADRARRRRGAHGRARWRRWLRRSRSR